jgi:hypothetical protein
LALAMGTVYVLAEYLRGRPAAISGEDRRAVETEIFNARAMVGPDPANLAPEIRDRLQQLQSDGRYAEALEAWKGRTGGDVKAAELKLVEEVRKQVEESHNSIGPGGTMSWIFSGIKTAGQETHGEGIVDQANTVSERIRVTTSAEFLQRMLYRCPVRINGVTAWVDQIGKDYFVAVFYRGDMSVLGADLAGREVSLVLDPTIQITYEATVTGDLPDDLLRGMWSARNPRTNAEYVQWRPDPVERPATLTFSSHVVSDDGRVAVTFLNLSEVSVRIDPKDIVVLYPVGGFGWNFARGGVLILLQLAFLAAVGVFAGSFLSFQVGCLFAFSMLPFSLARSFLTDAVKIPAAGLAATDFLTWLGHYLVKGMSILLPDFASTWPSNSLVYGLYISWSQLGQTAALTIAVRCAAVLGLGCLIFWKRELARVQV